MTYRTDDRREPESVRRISETARTTTKIAYRESSRQRMLSSRKTLNVPLKENELYKGEDLARGRR